MLVVSKSDVMALGGHCHFVTVSPSGVRNRRRQSSKLLGVLAVLPVAGLAIQGGAGLRPPKPTPSPLCASAAVSERSAASCVGFSTDFADMQRNERVHGDRRITARPPLVPWLCCTLAPDNQIKSLLSPERGYLSVPFVGAPTSAKRGGCSLRGGRAVQTLGTSRSCQQPPRTLRNSN